tara:strand:- start:8163 stop:8651 length:489 start_codon:yes stop_codon:yes gene_type:complete
MILKSQLKTDTVEKEFCIPFSKLRQEPMNEEETSIFLGLILSEKQSTSDAIDPQAVPFSNYQVLVQSLGTRFSLKITQEAAIMVSVMSRVFGDVIMYLSYLQYHYSIDEKKITCARLSDIFPMGFPSKTSLERMWDLQKVARDKDSDSDNLLDYKECFKSIM